MDPMVLLFPLQGASILLFFMGLYLSFYLPFSGLKKGLAMGLFAAPILALIEGSIAGSFLAYCLQKVAQLIGSVGGPLFLQNLGFYFGDLASQLASDYGPISAPIFGSYLGWLALTYLFLSYAIKTLTPRSLKVRQVWFNLCHILLIVASCGLFIPVAFITSLLESRFGSKYGRLVSGKPVLKNPFWGAFFIRFFTKSDDKQGLQIHEHFRTTIEAKRTGVLVVGKAGSGKTNLIYHQFMKPAFIESHSLSVIYDFKGDFTEAHGEDSDTVLLSCFDRRSATWLMSEDINTSSRFLEFMGLMVPEMKGQDDGFFQTATTDIATAIFLKLKEDFKGRFSFGDFYAMIHQSEAIFSAIKTYRPDAQLLVEGDVKDSRQIQGILGTIRTRMLPLEPLARMWPKNPSSGGFSYLKWFESYEAGEPEKRKLIIKASPRYDKSSEAFVKLIIDLISLELSSLPESRTRSIYVFIDELQTLPRLKALITGVRTLRSRGVQFIVGTQDFGRTRYQYDQDGGTEGFVGNFGFKLFGALDSPEAVDYASKLCGRNVYELRANGGSKDGSVQFKTITEDALPSGALMELQSPSLARPASFYISHSGWPLVKMAYKIRPIGKSYLKDMEPDWVLDADLTKKKKNEEPKTSNSSKKPTIKSKYKKILGPGHDLD